VQRRVLLLDHLVGGDEQRLRNDQAERLCSIEVDKELQLSRLLDRKTSGPFSPLRRSRIAASAAEKQKLQTISGRDVRARWTCLTFFAKLLSSLFVEHSREMPAFGAFVRYQRPKPTSRRYLQYFLHRRAAFLAEWHINALASLITRHATLALDVIALGVFRVNTLELNSRPLSEVSAAALRSELSFQAAIVAGIEPSAA
jgi:hypothetical protein